MRKKLSLLLMLIAFVAVVTIVGCDKEDEVIDNSIKKELLTRDKDGNPIGRPLPPCYGQNCY